MEPAGDRREHTVTTVPSNCVAVEPQWSPPAPPGSEFSTVPLPQWSPPVIGGSTPSIQVPWPGA